MGNNETPEKQTNLDMMPPTPQEATPKPQQQQQQQQQQQESKQLSSKVDELTNALCELSLSNIMEGEQPHSSMNVVLLHPDVMLL
ncbi:hypothetical protein EV182_003973, partial [Spiromyces aspiralis]